MPVEIRELIIRAVINSQTDEPNMPQAATTEEERAAIVEACVQQVLRILEKKKER